MVLSVTNVHPPHQVLSNMHGPHVKALVKVLVSPKCEGVFESKALDVVTFFHEDIQGGKTPWNAAAREKLLKFIGEQTAKLEAMVKR